MLVAVDDAQALSPAEGSQLADSRFSSPRLSNKQHRLSLPEGPAMQHRPVSCSIVVINLDPAAPIRYLYGASPA